MKPGLIQVFDGLRITTQHVNHLQGSFHSAIHDIRKILGLGRVYSGFEVVKEGEDKITVMPGLAFDFVKNRIVCSEPKTVEVSNQDFDETQYVCVKYEQVEDGVVEGKPTLIWDSCSVLIRSEMPAAVDATIPIAKLVKLEEEKTFEIISLLPKKKKERAKDKSEEERKKLGMHGIKEGTESREVAEELETALGVEGRPVVEIRKEKEATQPTGPESLEYKTEQSKLRVQQGVVHLTSDPGLSKNIGTLILEPIKDMAESGEVFNEGEVLIPLAEKEVSLDFVLSSLTCLSIITGTLVLTEEVTPAETTEADEDAQIYTKIEFESTSQGECTVSDGVVAQFGISKVQVQLTFDSEKTTRWKSDLTEIGIGYLSFSLFLSGVKSSGYTYDSEILKHLQLILRVNKSKKEGFKVTSNLLWKGGNNGEILKKIQTQEIGLQWEAIMTWKAVGGLLE